MMKALFIRFIHTLVEKSLHMKAFLWSKTSLNTGGVGGTREAIPTCKMVAFLYVLDTN